MENQGAGGGLDSGRGRRPSEADPVQVVVEEIPTPPKQADEVPFQQLGNDPRAYNLRSRGSATPAANTGLRTPTSRSESPITQPVQRESDYQPGTIESAPCTTKSQPRPLEPPVTRTTLSELDVAKIVSNPKLRHDINFDPELHFRPNLDGEKGRRKQAKANQFWKMLEQQLEYFALSRPEFYLEYGNDEDWSLPSLLRAVKDIIQTLVPQRDREFLNDGLNVELLMQQFAKGVADLEKLASWLSGVLKLHCAPMRDEWVDEMYNKLSRGNRENNMAELVQGMRSLLSVLEAMKLDVANHQIRCLRPVLIEDTVQFEQRFFLKKIQARKLDIGPTKAWYRTAQEVAALQYADVPLPYSGEFGEAAVFFNSLSRLVLPSTQTEAMPNSFLFDEERLIKLRSDILDAICLELCMKIFENYLYQQITGTFSLLPSYVEDDSFRSRRLSGEMDTNFSAASSRPASYCGSTDSSPRNSGLIFSQPTLDLGDSRKKAAQLYSSLVALLQTAQPTSRASQRWEVLCPAMALEMFRHLDLPLDQLQHIERNLRDKLRQIDREPFQQAESDFHDRLLAELAVRVKEFRKLSAVSLFSVATGGRIHGSGRSWDAVWEREHRLSGLMATPDVVAREAQEGLKDMATRLAHLGVLHWRVWAPLAYLVDIEDYGNPSAAASGSMVRTEGHATSVGASGTSSLEGVGPLGLVGRH